MLSWCSFPKHSCKYSPPNTIYRKYWYIFCAQIPQNLPLPLHHHILSTLENNLKKENTHIQTQNGPTEALQNYSATMQRCALAISDTMPHSWRTTFVVFCLETGRWTEIQAAGMNGTRAANFTVSSRPHVPPPHFGHRGYPNKMASLRMDRLCLCVWSLQSNQWLLFSAPLLSAVPLWLCSTGPWGITSGHCGFKVAKRF